MKTVEVDARRSQWLLSAIVICCGIGGPLGLHEARAALVTKTIQFNEADGFVVAGSTPDVQGLKEYVIDGMRVSIQGADSFLYPQRNSGKWVPQPNDSSTSLGSQASFGGEVRQFLLSLDNPTAGQTFDMNSIVLSGYADASSGIGTSVTFTGTKLGGATVEATTSAFDAGSRDTLTFDFDNLATDDPPFNFRDLVSLTWQQGGTNRQHQFDNITFSTVAAVPEPGSLLAMLVLTATGIVARGRRWIGERL